MIDLLIQLLANRLGVFIIGVMFVAGGIYTWQTYRAEATLYDSASGFEGRTVTGTVAWKNQERVPASSRDDGSETLVDYFTIEFEHDGEPMRVKIYVDSNEYAARNEGDPIEVKYHPANPEFIVTPDVERESTLLALIFTVILIGIGILIDLAVLVSLL